MTPDQISTLSSLATLFEAAGSWPLLSVLLVLIFAPWGFALYVTRLIERKHDEAVKMYEDNAELVRSYQKMADNLQSLVIANTKAITAMTDVINANMYCPNVRQMTKQREPGG